jgi:hypothetical protein
MGNAQLFLHHDELRVRDVAGESFTPTADDLYAYKFENSTDLRGIKHISERADVAKLTVSRLPLELRIKPRTDESGALGYISVGIHEGIEYQIPTLLERMSDT